MSLLFLTGLVLSAAIGLSLGLIGGGGSILTVPILVYFLGIDAHEAVGMSLAVVGATSAFGAYLHHRRGNLVPSSGLLFGISGIGGALAGSPLTRLVPSDALLLIFAGLMFVVAASMLWRRRNPDAGADRQVDSRKAVAAGFGVGVLTGFLGVGGGFLIVPALVLFGGLAMKPAIGTSLLVIAMNSAAGFVGHLAQTNVDLALTFLVLAIAIGGTIAGTILSHRLAPARLQRAFALLVIGVAVFLVVKNFEVFDLRF
ncbi:MAG: sulfite exporter TauE/SafE family protein [Acidobacteria bacterium]|nr:sulfite exporter TauE/SafE family protein [Acidobacteriota bacterium]MBK8147956.1 sulfite exporter TauE/SafE family protein [Acidobacteriota bacterium]MBK8813522.1 sulfite exporter TauE/SafE family protein [Acidobacteriota bacterium]